LISTRCQEIKTISKQCLVELKSGTFQRITAMPANRASRDESGMTKVEFLKRGEISKLNGGVPCGLRRLSSDMGIGL
jgi:hypothetical protein